MNILLSRLDGGVKRLLGKTQLSEDGAKGVHRSLRVELEMATELIENSYGISLKFANELSILNRKIGG